MADSFSVDPGNAVTAGGNASTQPVLNQTQGVGGGNVNSVPTPVLDTSQSDATIKALLQLGSDVLAPKVKEAQAAQFMSGVEKAAQGEALTDIVKEQPWYTQIFGPSNAAMGARAYSTAEQIARFGADMESQMPLLAQQGPEVLRKYAQDSMKALLTGDPMADQAIQMAYVDQMGPLFKRHAKENYIYNQKLAVDQQGRDFKQLGDVYESRARAAAAPEATLSAKDLMAEQDKLLNSLAPFPGQTDQSYEKSLTGFIEAQASAGNFHAIKLLKDKGIYDAIPNDMRAALDRSMKPFARQALNQQMPNYAVDMRMIVDDMAQDPRKVAARVAALNEKAARDTGITEAQLIPPEQVDNIVGNVLRHQASAGAAKADTDFKLAVARSALTQPGMMTKAIGVGATDAKSSEKAMIEAWAQTKDPAQRALMLNASTGTTYDGVKENLLQPLGSEEYNDAIGQSAAVFSKLTPYLQGKYYSDEKLRSTMTRFQSMIDMGTPPEAAWLTANKTMPLTEFQVPDKERSDIQKGIRSWVESNHENFVGWNNVDDAGLNTLEAMTMQAYKRERVFVKDPEVAIARALATVEARGAQVIGKHVAIGSNGQRPLFDMLRVPDASGHSASVNETKAAFEAVMEEKAKLVGGNLKEMNIVRGQDYKGDARFLVESYDKEGMPKRWTIMGKEVREKAWAKSQAEVQRITVESDPVTARQADMDWLKKRQEELNPKR